MMPTIIGKQDADDDADDDADKDNITHQDFPRETSLHSQDRRLNKFLFATKMKTCVLITLPIAL